MILLVKRLLNDDAETGVNFTIYTEEIVDRVILASTHFQVYKFLSSCTPHSELSSYFKKKIVKSKKVKKKTVIYCTYTYTCMHVSCILVVIYHQGSNILDLLGVLFL